MTDLRTVGEAILLRVWVAHPIAGKLWDQYRSLASDDDCLVCPAFPEWHETAAVAEIGRAASRHAAVLNLVPTTEYKVQGKFLRILLAAHVWKAREMVASRLWKKLGVPSSEQALFAAGRCVENLRYAVKEVGFTHSTSYIKSMFNAWTTSARMGREPERCPFCRKAKGDSIQHIAACPRQWELRQQILPQLRAGNLDRFLVESFLGAAFLSPERAVATVLWHDGVAFATHAIGHGAAGSAENLVVARMRAVVSANSRALFALNRFGLTISTHPVRAVERV
jgi:hypothetical protein